MSFSNADLVRHILDEINFVLSEVSSITKDKLIMDPVLSRAVVRSLEIIGEASKKISPSFKSTHKEIEWRKMAATRDKLIHDYFGVDYDILWDIVQNKLPGLKALLEKAISNTNPPLF